MNTSDIKFLRYLDDFIILGPNEKDVKGVLKKAVRLLDKLNLSVYKIEDRGNKANFGSIANKFEFLGIEIEGKKY